MSSSGQGLAEPMINWPKRKESKERVWWKPVVVRAMARRRTTGSQFLEVKAVFPATHSHAPHHIFTTPVAPGAQEAFSCPLSFLGLWPCEKLHIQNHSSLSGHVCTFDQGFWPCLLPFCLSWNSSISWAHCQSSALPPHLLTVLWKFFLTCVISSSEIWDAMAWYGGGLLLSTTKSTDLSPSTPYLFLFQFKIWGQSKLFS